MRDVPSLIVNVIAKPGGIHHGQRNTNALLFELCETHTAIPSATFSLVSAEEDAKKDAPTVMGLIWIPGSTWAILGSTGAAWSRTLDSQSVLTNVVRPVPDVPIDWNVKGMNARHAKGREPRSDVPTTMSVS